MKVDPHTRAVALSGLAALAEAEVPMPDALRAVGARTRGALGVALARAAERVAGGQSVSGALAPAFPELAPLLGGDDAELPARLARLAQRARAAWRLERRLRAVSAYPVLLAVGLLLIVGGIAWARHGRPGFDGSVPPPDLLVVVALGALAVVGLGTTFWAVARRRAPVWARLLPGHEVWRLSAVADFAALYSVHRELGDADPGLAARRASGREEADLRSPVELAAHLGASTAEAAALAAIEAAPDPAGAAAALAERLDAEAGAAGARLVASTGYALLLLMAIGVLLMLYAVYGALFSVSGSLL